MTTQTDTLGIVGQGGAAVLLANYYNNALTLALPFCFVALILVVVDLYFGCGAARARGEVVKATQAARRTLDKLFSYACWIVLAASMSVAFQAPNLNWIILACVMGIELCSIVGNYLGKKGKKIVGLDELLKKIIGDKIQQDLSEIKIEDDNDNS